MVAGPHNTCQERFDVRYDPTTRHPRVVATAEGETTTRLSTTTSQCQNVDSATLKHVVVWDQVPEVARSTALWSSRATFGWFVVAPPVQLLSMTEHSRHPICNRVMAVL